MKTLRKYHKWPSLVIGLFVLLFCLSGIVMNHRAFFSPVDVSRKWIPSNYTFKNWNLAAVKGSVWLADSTQLIYGNIGIWKTDRNFNLFTNFNQGLPKGSDHRKTFSLLQTRKGELWAGTLFGLYDYHSADERWQNYPLPENHPRVVKVLQHNDSIFVLTRSALYIIKNNQGAARKYLLPYPEKHDGKASLFRTTWIIHSGELLGLAGKLVVDLTGLILIILTLTGFYYTFVPSLAKRSGQQLKSKLKKFNRFSIRWHNRLGVYWLVILLVTTITGMFLRPPLLIPIANGRISPLGDNHGTNFWHDKLRDMVIDSAGNRIIISSSEGFYHWELNDVSAKAETFSVQPPVSVMGINVFEPLDDGLFLVGSFSGLYRWNIHENIITDAITGLPAKRAENSSPFGSLAVAGVLMNNHGPTALFDYDAGWMPLRKGLHPTPMPRELMEIPLSLWNLSLEIHTGRIFSLFLGDFYILYVPLMGICLLLILITGLWMWLKQQRRKKPKKGDKYNENYHTG
jgi:hypothetical protein